MRASNISSPTSILTGSFSIQRPTLHSAVEAGAAPVHNVAQGVGYSSRDFAHRSNYDNCFATSIVLTPVEEKPRLETPHNRFLASLIPLFFISETVFI